MIHCMNHKKVVVPKHTRQTFYVGGKIHSRTGHEGPQGQETCSSTLSLNSGQDGSWVINATLRPIYPQGREPVPILEEVQWATWSVWTGEANVTRIGTRSPDRLSYPSPQGKGKAIPV
jgi:hypothetical protein